ncbi:putative PAT complex subunit Asterix [Dioscorea sansibarensis]
MKESTASASDPRQPATAKVYVPPAVAPQDMPFDYSGFFAVIFGVAGFMLRYKLCSWLAIIFSVQAISNMKNFENDFKQISMAMMFGIMGLIATYFGPARPAKTQS